MSVSERRCEGERRQEDGKAGERDEWLGEGEEGRREASLLPDFLFGKN